MTNTISIIIPLFNRKNLIKETVDSILAQSSNNFECIIIDDHSTDDSFEVINDYIGEDNRFIISKRISTKKGASVCRNEGIDIAKGSYIMFLDSDDLMDPNCISRRMEVVQSNSQNDFYVFQAALFSHETYIVKNLWSNIGLDNDLNAFINSNGWCISNSLFSTNFLKNNHYFNEDAQSWQDVEFHIRALLKTTNYSKYPNTQPDVFIRVSNIARVSNTNLSYKRIHSRLEGYLTIEKEFLINNIRSFEKPFLIYYFKYLEIAARTLPGLEFIALRDYLFSNTKINNRKLKYLRFYLNLQFKLTKYHMYYVGSIFYKIIRLFLSNDLLYAKNRKIAMQDSIDLRSRLKTK